MWIIIKKINIVVVCYESVVDRGYENWFYNRKEVWVKNVIVLNINNIVIWWEDDSRKFDFISERVGLLLHIPPVLK